MKYEMFDIHMHIIPGVDDGSMDLEMSQVMLLQAWRQEIRRVIATPHSGAFAEYGTLPRERFCELQRKMSWLLPEFRLYLGCEVHCEKSCMDAVLKRLERGIYPSMNGTRYVLTEFSNWVTEQDALDMVRVLQQAGWKPILAHMERYRNLQQAERFQDEGCRIQVNAYSVLDEQEPQIRKRAIALLDKQQAAFLGSDAHRTYFRPPSIEWELQWMAQRYDPNYLEQLTHGNAETAFLNGEEDGK